MPFSVYAYRFYAKHGSDWKTIACELGKHRKHVKGTTRRTKSQHFRKGLLSIIIEFWTVSHFVWHLEDGAWRFCFSSTPNLDSSISFLSPFIDIWFPTFMLV